MQVAAISESLSTLLTLFAPPIQGTQLEQLTQVTRETAPLGPTEYLLHKATLLRLRDIAALLNNRNKHRKATTMKKN